MSLAPVRLLGGASLLALGLAFGSAAATAQTADGWYAGALGGVNINEDNQGWGAGILGGYDFGTFRIQADLIRRQNDAEAGKASEVYSWAPMVSALYDIPTGTAFRPYIGAGVGGADVTLDGNAVSESEWNFAYQGIVGLAYDMDPNWEVGVEYRYFSAFDNEYDNPKIQAHGYDYDNHSVFFGITYKLGTPVAPPPAPVATPAPPPAPAPELARSYLVFFDWNSTAITPEAATIINEAASAAKQLAVTRIDLTGHADRSGTDAYNQALSEKRGAAVKNALVQLGVPAAQIAVVGKGESSPLVPTADGVREPQNRRVEIVLP